MHLVLRAESARGKQSLLAPANARYLKNLIPSLAGRWGVTVYQVANLGNHVHLLIRARTRTGFQAFLRVLAGKVAQKVTGAQKGRPLAKRFWSLLA
jgi:REP element-mobilizing transposase RayT